MDDTGFGLMRTAGTKGFGMQVQNVNSWLAFLVLEYEKSLGHHVRYAKLSRRIVWTCRFFFLSCVCNSNFTGLLLFRCTLLSGPLVKVLT
jgi:hypothetical protein